MSTLDIESLDLISTLRKAPLNGSPTSADYNDSQRELLADSASLASLVNDKILPLLNALSLTALTPTEIGIEGRTIFSDTSDNSQLFFDSTQVKSLTLAESLRLLDGMLTVQRQQLIDMGIEVASLQATLASTNQNDIALALQNLSGSLNTITIRLAGLTTDMANISSAALQSTRFVTASITAGASQTFDIPWPVPYGDDNYTVIVSMQDGTGSLTIVSFTYTSPIGSGISVIVRNTDTTLPHAGTIHAFARHD